MRFRDFIESAVMGTSGRSEYAAQTAKSTDATADNFLANPNQTDFISRITQKSSSPTAIKPLLIKAGAMAMDTAPNSLASKAEPGKLPAILSQKLGIPNVIKAPEPMRPIKFMRGD